MPSSYFSLNSPVQAIDFSSLIIFTLIFSLELSPSFRGLLPLYKIDFIAFIPYMQSPLAVVNDLFLL